MRIFLAFLIAAFLGPAAMAAEAGKKPRATYGITGKFLNWSQTTVKTTQKIGPTETVKTTELAQNDGLGIEMHIEGINAYYFPLSRNTEFALTYQVRPDLEAGIVLNLFGTTMDKTPKLATSHQEVSHQDFGVTAIYSLPIAMGATLEIVPTLEILSESSKETTVTAGVPTTKKEDWSGSLFSLGVDFVHPCGENWDFMAGLLYTSSSKKESETDEKVSITRFAFYPLGFSANF